MNSTVRRALTVTGAAGTALALVSAPALAHVTVQSPGATQGGFAKLTFRVPTEKEVATTKLQIVFPTDAPLANANVKPHPGWTYVVTKGKPTTTVTDHDGKPLDSVVQSITWTSTGAGVKPGEFDEFDVSAGPLPEVDEMVFRALQTYADGDVVRWIEPRVEGGAEPDHPAPVLKLAAAGNGGHGGSATSATPSASAASVSASAEDAVEADDDSETVAYAGVGLGALALLVAAAGFLRGRAPARS
jgi:uncharacterized protein